MKSSQETLARNAKTMSTAHMYVYLILGITIVNMNKFCGINKTLFLKMPIEFSLIAYKFEIVPLCLVTNFSLFFLITYAVSTFENRICFNLFLKISNEEQLS